MTWIVDSSGSQTAVINTEHSLATPSTLGNYRLSVDTVNMVNGDLLELRCYDMVDGSNYRQVYKGTYQHIQTNVGKISPDVAVTTQAKFTLKQTAGTGRVFPWSLRRDTHPANFNLQVIDGSGRVDVSKISGTSQTARDIGASVITASGTVTTVTNQLTAAQIATGIWQDTTAADFTTALSVGKSVMNGVSLGTGLTVASVSGAVGSVTGLTASNLDTTISSRMATYTQPTGFLAATFPTGTVANTTNITAGTIATVTNLTNAPTAGDLTATMKTSVTTAATAATPTAAAVTGAVGSVTGNIGGNVVGSVASVTARVTANADQINGNATAASNVANSMQAIARGTCSGGTPTTAVVSSMSSPNSLTAAGQLIGRTILFDSTTATTALRGQASNITGSTTGSTPTITFTAMTTAPANTDTFSVV